MEDRIAALYEAFNARDVDAVVAHVAPDVDWPDAMRGTRVLGRDALCAHWLGQWAVVDLQVTPRRARELPDGRVDVLVGQQEGPVHPTPRMLGASLGTGPGHEAC